MLYVAKRGYSDEFSEATFFGAQSWNKYDSWHRAMHELIQSIFSREQQPNLKLKGLNECHRKSSF